MWLKTMTRFLGFLLFFLSSSAFSAVTLPSIISDNMVLQQGKPIQLWGQAGPHERIHLSIANQTINTQADSKGYWATTLKPLQSGHTYLTIQSQTDTGKTHQQIINNIAVGEVWLASGQSNMEWPLRNTSNAKQAIAQSPRSDIRFFQVEKNTALSPLREVQGEWVVMSTQTAPHVSGVAYHFAQQLHQKLNTSIGMVESTWGNTKIQAWMSKSALESTPLARYLLNKLYQDTQRSPQQRQARQQALHTWEQQNLLQDSNPLTSPPKGNWQTINIPTTFNRMGFKQDGTIWFKREVTLPQSWQHSTATISLGKLDDFDQVYFNGVLIGETTKNTPHHWLKPRHYTVPSHLIKAGNNTIHVRIFDQYSDGGFTSPARHLKLSHGNKNIPLAGQWQYQIELQAKPKAVHWASKPKSSFSLHNRNTPAALYNAMIAPLTHFPIRGVIWYQGEADAGRAKEYTQYFPALIQQWRQAWRDDFPFLFVQLANFEADKRNPRSTTWAELRAAQAQAANQQPNVGMVTAIDVGNAHDIHPKDKATVGQRLAQKALATVYQQGNYSSPDIQNIQFEQGVFNIQFKPSMKLSNQGRITAFEIMDQHGRWHFASAKLVGNQITVWPVWSNHNIQARGLRYAWRNNPQANIHNQYGLPLKPFEHYLP